MLKEYDIEKLNPRRNPYVTGQKVIITMDSDTVEYFKKIGEKEGIPLEMVINLYLRDCKVRNRKLDIEWHE